MQVLVRDNNVDQALRVLKKKLQREGIFRELKRKKFYEKPSEKKTREKGEAIRRRRKLARKQAQREGLLPPSKPRVAGPGRPGMGPRRKRRAADDRWSRSAVRRPRPLASPNRRGLT